MKTHKKIKAIIASRLTKKTLTTMLQGGRVRWLVRWETCTTIRAKLQNACAITVKKKIIYKPWLLDLPNTILRKTRPNMPGSNSL
jgi:hypothetical protein